jgi:hypothetical protein
MSGHVHLVIHNSAPAKVRNLDIYFFWGQKNVVIGREYNFGYRSAYRFGLLQTKLLDQVQNHYFLVRDVTASRFML